MQMPDLAVRSQMKAYGARMSRSPRRWMLVASLVTAVGSVTAGVVAVVAAPAAVATPTHIAHTRVQPDGLLPSLPVCLPVLCPTPTPTVTTTSTATATATATSSSCTIPPPLDTLLCPILGGGATTLPSGLSSAAPNTFPNNASAQTVVITDPFEQLYSSGGGATVQLVGPSTINSIGDPTFDNAAGTITVTFDLTKPTPATPGAYTLTISPKSLSSLTSVLTGLGLPGSTTLPLDTVPVTVTEATGPAAVTGLTATPITSKTASLAWTAPTAATPAVTGYAIIVSKTATATATDSGVTVTQSGTTASASVAGLTPGTKYFVTVTPKSASGNGASANTSMLMPNDTSLTLDLTPANVVGQESVTAGGSLDKVTATGKSGLADKKVGIYVRYTGIAKGQLLKSVTTDANGEYAYSFTPKRGGLYAAVFLGDKGTSTTSGNSLAVSNAVTQTVTPTLTFSASGKAHGKHFTLKAKGKVSPAESSKKVIVYRTVKGAAQKLGAAHVTGSGAYKLVKKHLGRGTYHLQAKIKAHNGLQPASSNKFTVRAH